MTFLGQFENKARKVTFEQLKCLRCKFTLCTASAMPRTGRERWTAQTKDLWPPALGPPSHLFLGATTRHSPQMLFPGVWTSPILCSHVAVWERKAVVNIFFVPTGFHNSNLCFTNKPRPCTRSTQTQLISIWTLPCSRYLIHLIHLTRI